MMVHSAPFMVRKTVEAATLATTKLATLANPTSVRAEVALL
jgi:hypothetical protein